MKNSGLGDSTTLPVCVCVCVCARARARRDEKPTRCHCTLYCTYDTLNMFRALPCPSSGALDYMYAIAAYGVQCLVARCRGQVQGSRVCNDARTNTHLVLWVCECVCLCLCLCV